MLLRGSLPVSLQFDIPLMPGPRPEDFVNKAKLPDVVSQLPKWGEM